jgi:xanthine dehydrogenase molybdopterin-binding subunit B
VLLLLLQVRLVVPGDVDGSMTAGRFPMLLHWEAGLDAQGRLAGLSLDITCTVSGRGRETG